MIELLNMVPNQTTRRAHLGHLVGLTSGHEENPDANHGAGKEKTARKAQKMAQSCR